MYLWALQIFIARQHSNSDARPSVRPSVCSSVCHAPVLYRNGIKGRSRYVTYGAVPVRCYTTPYGIVRCRLCREFSAIGLSWHHLIASGRRYICIKFWGKSLRGLRNHTSRLHGAVRQKIQQKSSTTRFLR